MSVYRQCFDVGDSFFFFFFFRDPISWALLLSPATKPTGHRMPVAVVLVVVLVETRVQGKFFFCVCVHFLRTEFDLRLGNLKLLFKVVLMPILFAAGLQAVCPCFGTISGEGESNIEISVGRKKKY